MIFLPLFIPAQERIIIVNEGLWQTDNGSLSYIEDDVLISNHWFRDINGYKLGDTPNDIIQINDSLLAIAVNWSNIVQFLTPEGKAVAATEDVPNNRKLASDGNFLYVSSYGHECGTPDGFLEFSKGYVAKIDISNFQVVTATEVGYEPEGIAYYDGYVFVANTGGYAFQEDHDYETSISIINAKTMEVTRNVETGQINLYGKMSQSGQFVCINSPGDYYSIPAATIILDCKAVIEGKPDEECFVTLPYAATYNCVDREGNFYAIGSRYSYYTGNYTFNYVVLDPFEIMASKGERGIKEEMPGTVLQDIKNMMMPYGIYINPYSGHFYATDSASFTAAGELIHWDAEGNPVSRNKLYINPAHFLALKPRDEINSVESINSENKTKGAIFNLQGQKIEYPYRGQIYIKNGKKFINR